MRRNDRKGPGITTSDEYPGIATSEVCAPRASDWEAASAALLAEAKNGEDAHRDNAARKMYKKRGDFMAGILFEPSRHLAVLATPRSKGTE
jgi:hypothetical protein